MDEHRERERERERRRSLSSERRRDSRSKSRDKADAEDQEKEEAKKPQSKYEEGSMEAMMAAMGLPVGFETTKGKQVEGNAQGAVKVKQKREYRQYMNRKPGGTGKR